MTIMTIEVVPDPSIPAGGHAIIRLVGVALLPPGATFRIDPIDDAVATDGGWPHGDLHPLATRQTPGGIEMLIGPSVVDAPLLEPGTPVTISVPDGHLSAELVWPNIPVSTTTAVSSVVMTPSQMAAELAAVERSKMEAVQIAKTKAQEAAAQEAAAQEARRLADEEAERLHARVEAAVIDQRRMSAAARELEAALAATPSTQEPYATIIETGGRDANQEVQISQNPPMDRSREPDRSLSSLSKPIERADHAPVGERDTSLPSIILKRSSDGPPPPATIQPIELRRETIDGRVSPPSNGRLMPFLAGAGAAGIAAAAVFAVLMVRSGAPPFTRAVDNATTTAATKGLSEAFSAGQQSPRGETAVDVDLPTALRLADYNLHGVDRPVDRAEAEFWLKKAMSLTASHSQLRWAMTQLGTLAAEPVSGTPDYDRARMLWEISSANGDPVATCFLGTLQEFGLGVVADRSKALEQYKRSKELGGCPNTDEAIARLSK